MPPATLPPGFGPAIAACWFSAWAGARAGDCNMSSIGCSTTSCVGVRAGCIQFEAPLLPAARAGKFIRLISQNVKEKEDRLLHLAYDSLRKRVAKALVDIHHKFNGEQMPSPLDIPREDIAQYVGTATESLIRTLSDFKSEKLIEIKEGKIRITDLARLGNLLY